LAGTLWHEPRIRSPSHTGTKIEKFKQETWGHKLEAYFLDRKAQLDKVIYSLIRTQDMELPRNSISGFKQEQSFAGLVSIHKVQKPKLVV